MDSDNLTPEQLATVKRVEAVLEKYCVPKKEYDGIAPKVIAAELIKAVNNTTE
jgi:hypothetical protein